MSYSTKEEVREMLKDDALNAIIGDTFIEDPAEREELVEPLIEAAIADADAEIDGYLAKRYTVPISPAPRVLNKFSKDIAVYNLFSRSLLPTINDLMSTGEQVLTKVGAWVEENQELVRVIMLVVLAIGGFLTIAGTVIAVVSGVGLIITKVFIRPIGSMMLKPQ